MQANSEYLAHNMPTPASAAQGEETLQATAALPEVVFNGHQISTTPPRDFAEVNAAAMKQFSASVSQQPRVSARHISDHPPESSSAKSSTLTKAKEAASLRFDQTSVKGSSDAASTADGVHVIISSKVDESATSASINESRNLEIGQKGSPEFEAGVHAEYKSLTKGLQEQDGELVRVGPDGKVDKLNITAEGLVAVIRASHKTEGAATRLFSVIQDNTTSEIVKSEDGKETVLKGKQIAQGGAGSIFLAYDLIQQGATRIIKEADEFEKDEKSSLELEHENIAYVQSKAGKDAPIVATPKLGYRFEEAGLNRAGIVLPHYSGGDFVSFMSKRSEPLKQSDLLLSSMRIMDAVVILDKRQVLHADIKGGNVFVDSDGKAYLGDFDGMLKLDDASILETASKIAEGDFSRSSDAVSPGDEKILRSTAEAVVNASEKLASMKSGKAKSKDIQKATEELNANIGDLRGMCRQVHSFSVGCFTLALFATKDDVPMEFRDKDGSKGSDRLSATEITRLVASDNTAAIVDVAKNAATRLPKGAQSRFKTIMENALSPLGGGDASSAIQFSSRIPAGEMIEGLVPVLKVVLADQQAQKPVSSEQLLSQVDAGRASASLTLGSLDQKESNTGSVATPLKSPRPDEGGRKRAISNPLVAGRISKK